MVISCPSCGKRFGVREDLVPAGGRRARCAACGEVFTVYPSMDSAGEDEEVHFKRIPMPGDGLASDSSFVAPAAPLSSLPGHRPSDGSTTEGGQAPVLIRPTPGVPEPDSPASDPAGSTLGATVAISADELAALRKAARAPGPDSGEGRWRVRDAKGSELTCGKKDLVRMIRAGEVIPDTHLIPEGGGSEWVRAADVEELGYYFDLKTREEAGRVETPGTDGLTCVDHAQREATDLCGRCSIALCGGCVRERRFGAQLARCCPRCGEPCRTAVAPRRVTAFWEDLPRVLRFPVVRGGAVMLFFYGTMGIFAQLAPFMGFLFSFFLLTYNMMIVQASSRGRDRVPDWPEFSSWWEIVARGLRAYAVTVVCLLPIILFNFLMFGQLTGPLGGGGGIESRAGPVPSLALWLLGNLVLAALCLVYYPMAFGISSMFNTLAPILNPVLVFRAIGRIPGDYAAVVLFFFLSWLPVFILDVVLGLLRVPFSGLLTAFLYAYMTFAQMHVLGWTLYRAEDRLNFDVRI